MRWRGRTRVALLLVPLLAGCTTVGPDFAPPQPSLPTAYHAPVPALFQGTADPGHWWRYLDDPVLDDLIARGLEANLDIPPARSRVREARAVARGAVARTGPSLDASADAGVQFRRDSADNDNDSRTGARAGASLDGAWQADLFGRLTRSREAAWARAARAEALGDEARRLGIAEIARNYVELRGAERRLKLTRQSLEGRRQTLSLVEQRVDAGLAPALDRVRARANVATLEADVGPLRARISGLRNALAVLLAEPPGALDAQLAQGRARIPASATGRAIGVPADLLRRRPDVRAAELQMAVASADIGIAVAELYPRLTLPGSIGIGWTGIGDGSVVTTVLASLSALFELPLYDGGERQANITAAEERLVQATADYRLTLLQALRDVEAALSGYQGALDSRESLLDAVENNRLAYEQSQALYRQGFVTFIDVLDSQRTWNLSRQALAIAERNVSLEVINLYSALGGDIESKAARTPG